MGPMVEDGSLHGIKPDTLGVGVRRPDEVAGALDEDNARRKTNLTGHAAQDLGDGLGVRPLEEYDLVKAPPERRVCRRAPRARRLPAPRRRASSRRA